MKISVISSATKDPRTAVASVALNLKAEFTKKGHSCDLLFREDLAPGLNGPLKHLTFSALLPARIVGRGYDVLDIAAGDGITAALCRRLTGSRTAPLLVARSHGLEHVASEMLKEEARAQNISLSWKYPLYHGGFRLWQVGSYLRAADLVLLLNARDRDYAVERLRVDPHRIAIVENGLPNDFLGLPAPEPAASAIRIAMVGRFDKRKGAEYAAPSLSALLEREPRLQIGLFGVGTDSASVLNRFPPACRDRILVVPSFDHRDLPGLLSGYHIQLMASLSEGFPLAALEGMACGLALVTTSVSGIAERLTHGTQALIVPPRDSAAIEAAINMLLQNPDLLFRMQRAGYEYAQTVSWNRVAETTLSLYRNAIEQRRAAR